MAGGKNETPRQKMIGMMYLVLTALLALNVSKDILKGFITVNESLERSNATLIDNQIKSLADFRKYAKNDSIARIHLQITEDVFKLTQEGYDYVGKLKAHVIAGTEKLDDPKVADTMHLRYTEKQDDYDTPTYILIGEDEANPKSGEFSAKELKAKIIEIHDKMIAKVNALQKNEGAKLLEADYNRLMNKIKAIYPIEPTEREEGVLETWETQNFNHLPLAAVITNLTKIQSDIKSVETSFLGELSSASIKNKTQVNVFSAQVISSDGYVQQGMPFKADIFLAASSTDFTNENLQVLLGGEYNFEKKSAIKEGDPLTTEGGKGKYEVVTNSTGEQVINGAIRLKKPDNKFEYYPYEYKYMVAAPSTAISAEKMNVMYIGLENPVAISAAGVAPSNLVVSCSGNSGASIVAKGNGKYLVKVTQKGECFVTVSARMPDGTIKQQGPPMRFRVKTVPEPMIKVGGKDITTGFNFKKSELSKISGVGAILNNFEFENVNFTVSSYKLYITQGNTLKQYDITGPNIPLNVKQDIIDAKNGSKIFIEDIIANGPSGKVKLGDVIIKVKS